MRRLVRPWAILVVLLALLPAQAHAADTIGVLLLHGKTGMPGQMKTLSAALRGAGYVVGAPEMCWSKKRIYDQALPGCLADIDAAIGRLKGEGATKVVLGGTSLGAVVALDYAATHPGLAGVIAIVPAGDPTNAASAPALVSGIAQAEALIKAGKGDQPIQLADIINGAQPITVTATPNAYMSFHAADGPITTLTHNLGPMVMPKIGAPCLWIAATRDPSQQVAPSVFATLPHNALSQLVKVDADHPGAPDASGSAATAWLATLVGN
jgi:dienelactone hydrolase